MVEDIRLKLGVLQHLKLRKLRRELGPEGLLGLISLWLYAAQYHPKGTLSGLEVADIHEAAGSPSCEPDALVATLVRLRLLDQLETGEYAVHDWEENQRWAYYSDERSTAARQKAARRWEKTAVQNTGNGNADSMQAASTQHANGNAPFPSPIPSPSPIPKPRTRSKPTRAKTALAYEKGPAGFRLFWETLPPTHREEPDTCIALWKSLDLEPHAQEIVTSLQAQLGWGRYAGPRLMYLKRAPSWLRKRRWLDEPDPAEAGSAGTAERIYDGEGNLL